MSAESQGTIDRHLERTLVLVKPDGVRRGLTGEILGRFERKTLKIIGLRMTLVDEELAKAHYRYDDIAKRHGEMIWLQLVEYLQEGPVIAVALEGIGAVQCVRTMVGDTEPARAAPGTLRGDYCAQTYAFSNDAEKAVYNVVHASATREEAAQELGLWFAEEHLLSYRRSEDRESYYS